MPQLRLQHKQWFAGAMIVACCLALGGTYFFHSLDAFRRVNASLREFERFNAVLAALNAITVERRPAHLAMLGVADEGVKLNEMRAARVNTDKLISKAEAALAGSADEAEILSSFEEGRSRIARARRLTDEVLATSPGARTNASTIGAVNAMFMAYESTGFARDRLGQTIALLEPSLSLEVYLAISASALRDQAGRLIAFTLEGLRTDETPNPKRDRAFYSTVGRLWAIREDIRNFSVSAKADPTVSATLWSVDHEFYSVTIPKVTLIYTDPNAAAGTTSAAFGEAITADLQKLQQLRQALESWSYSRAIALRDRALYGVVLSAILSVLGTLIVLLTSITLQRLLFAPLMMARKQIVAMANGDLSDPPSVHLRSPEMEEMFQGLVSLREEQRFRRQLEADQRRMAEQLKRLSETDMLTGLLNRRALEEAAASHVRKANETGEEMGLILFDIDHFKAINDSYGHAAGDAVLQAVATGLRRTLPRDATFARIGGEEFVVLLWGDPAEAAVAVADHLHVTLRQMGLAAVCGQRVTASFGVVVRNDDSALDFRTMLTVADRRLYAAKRGGRDQVCSSDTGFDPRRVAVTSRGFERERA